MTTTTTPRKLFVNLAIKDATRSRAFFSALGFTFNEQFSTADTLCMVLSEQGYVMLLEEARFKEFTGREVCDTATHTEGIFALSAGQPRGRRRAGAQGVHGRRRGGAEAAGPRLHVRLEFLRPRWPPLGGLLDGSRGGRAADRRGWQHRELTRE